ncbi:MAG: hypothetical protein P8Y99_11595 [Calditrichaceae bacterium]|jgi:hypothetical protein
MTLEKAFKPTGFLARFAEVDAGDEDSDTTKSAFDKFMDHFGVELWYNRVDALHTGLKYKQSVTKRLSFQILGAYNNGSEKWASGGEINLKMLKNEKMNLGLSYYINTASQFSADLYPWLFTSLLPLFDQDDYYDYYWREHLRADVGFKWSKADLLITAGFNREYHDNLYKATNWNILNKSIKQRRNPEIEKGELRSIDLKIEYGEKVPFGIVGSNYADFNVEVSTPDLFNSDFNFIRYYGSLEWRFNTFLKRRILPNALDFKIMGGYSTGDLPIQRYGALEGNLFAFTPFGGFRTLNGQVYRGEKYAALMWEHNFRTVPFELIGLRYLAKKGIGIIMHGAHGRTWIDKDSLWKQDINYLYTDKIHHEIGLSINGIFDFLRFDMTQRLDQKAFYIGLSFARMF